MKFLGQIVDAHGVRPDPNKVTAIRGMAAPMNTTELRRYLGMINQLSKFTPNIVELTKPLRELLSKKNKWTWNEIHQKAFSKLKDEVSTHISLNFCSKLFLFLIYFTLLGARDNVSAMTNSFPGICEIVYLNLINLSRKR